MAKALLINPSTVRTYGSNEGGIAFPVVPVLGLASIAGAIRDAGHEVRILDLSYLPYQPGLVRQALLDDPPDIVGITATTPLMNQARDLSFLCREVAPQARTILGGAHASALPSRSLGESAFDFVAAGEADFTIARLLDGADDREVPGLWIRAPDGAAIAPSRSGGLLEDLDDLPLPAWERYPMEVNQHITRFVARHRPMTVLEFSRGCIYGCDFCASKNTMGRGYRKKSPERCAEEVVRLAQQGFREALLVDDIFTTDNDWAAAVCEAIIATGVRFPWTASNGIRVDSADPELFKLMRRAGCYRVYFGFESGNDEVLRAFGKGGQASVAKGIAAVRMARKAGLETDGFFMVGLTGDTEDSMEQTIDFARRAPLDAMKCGICVPFPGTPMFQSLNASGHLRALDWDSYTVYNKTEQIFVHPTLELVAIKRAFRRFYVRALALNPSYLLRRFVFMVRHGEILLTMRNLTKFWVLIWGRGKPAPEQGYAYEDQWRRLDVSPGELLEITPILRVRRVGSVKRGTAVVTARDEAAC